MITKYRNRALIYFVCSVILTTIAALAGIKLSNTIVSQRGGALIATFVIGCIAGWVSWILVGFSLARAKGYSKDLAGPLFVIVYLFSICLPFLVIGFPLFILFGMEDRAKQRKRK